MTAATLDPVQFLSSVLATPSLCGQEDDVAALFLAAMHDLGFDDAARDEVGNVVGQVGPRNGVRSVVVLGHMDTVPGAIPVREEAGRLYGRGAVDAKGPLSAAICAAALAAPALRAQVTVVGAVQEEGPSTGARHLIGWPPPDFLIIAEPSGWDSIVLGYKGSQRFTATIATTSAHTAGPDATAAERAVEFWNALVSWCASRNRTGEPGEGFEDLSPTLIGMSSHDDGLTSVARLHIGLRLPPGLGLDAVREGVRALFPDGSLEFGPGEEAVKGGKGNPLVSAFVRSIREEGATPRIKVKTGTSDMNVVGPVWGCPMLAYGPGDSRLDHTPAENVVVDEYLRAIRVLRRVLEEL